MNEKPMTDAPDAADNIGTIISAIEDDLRKAFPTHDFYIHWLAARGLVSVTVRMGHGRDSVYVYEYVKETLVTGAPIKDVKELFRDVVRGLARIGAASIEDGASVTDDILYKHVGELHQLVAQFPVEDIELDVHINFPARVIKVVGWNPEKRYGSCFIFNPLYPMPLTDVIAELNLLIQRVRSAGERGILVPQMAKADVDVGSVTDEVLHKHADEFRQLISTFAVEDIEIVPFIDFTTRTIKVVGWNPEKMYGAYFIFHPSCPMPYDAFVECLNSLLNQVRSPEMLRKIV